MLDKRLQQKTDGMDCLTCHVCSAAGHEGTAGANGSDWEIGASGQSLIPSFIACVVHNLCERFNLR